MTTCKTALKMFLVMTLLLGGGYTALVTLAGKLFFPAEAEGSLLKNSAGVTVGSALLAQKFTREGYFWSRPSAGDYQTVPSAASNWGPTSADLLTAVGKRQKELSPYFSVVPADMLFTSASGLDPHIVPSSAWAQIPRIAAARHMDPAVVRGLVAKFAMGPQWGCLGESTFHVLEANLALDEAALVNQR